MTRYFPFPRFIALGSLSIWLATAVLAVALLAAFQYRSGLAQLSDWTRGTDTFLAEKLAQHDAHMTALAAVIRMSPNEPSASVQGLGESITAFYPRVTDIATISIDGAKAHVIAYGKPQGPTVEADLSAGDLPKLGKPGETAVRPIPERHAYDIYKLVEAGRLLRLRINAAALLATDNVPPGYSVSLSLGDTVLFSRVSDRASIVDVKSSLSASNPGQPLHLSISEGFSLGELFPFSLVLPLLLGSAAAVWFGVQYRNARREKRRQERRATLLEQETRLAHAGRVNALGEMASGIAHELTQPIAAILSQSQAARRALTLDRTDILEQALDANIREAKRAGDILGRMRAYISGAEARIERVALSEALHGALRLVEADLARQAIALDVVIADAPCVVAIDLISFQQVIHNLIRNAADAVSGQPDARITLKAGPQNAQAIIVIADNGPGIDANLLDRIFEPFFTTKPDGMGLGLPLCVRLIEKVDGTIDVRNDGGAWFTIRLPAGGAA